MTVLNDITSATYVGIANTFFFIRYAIVEELLRYLRFSEVDNSQNDDKGELKVVGVGYGRTGTYSLTLALTELGYPTLHSFKLFSQDLDILKMWADNVFIPSFHSKELSMGNPDFDIITSKGFTAVTDLPVSLYFKEIRDKYPNCKFILTKRDNPQVWFRSWTVMLQSFPFINLPVVQAVFYNAKIMALYIRWLSAIVNNDESILTTPLDKLLPMQREDQAIASYLEHNRRVKDLIPANQLLEFNVKEGWAPLCKFLEVAECPRTPFPNTNNALFMKVHCMVSYLTPLTIVLFILFSLFAWGFKKLTGERVLQWVEKKWVQFLRPLNNRGGQKRVGCRKKRF